MIAPGLAALASVLLAQAAPASPPPARRGFQAALAVQRAEARGDVLPELPHRDRLRAANELEAQLGWKLTDRVLAGIYVGGGRSLPGRDVERTCDALDVDCTGATRRAGAIVKLDLRPARAWNPWVAVAGGIERHDVEAAVLAWGPAVDAPLLVVNPTHELRGGELRLLAGVDLRWRRAAGLGLHVAASVGDYREVGIAGASPTSGGAVPDAEGGTHAWLTFGVHGVLFP